MKLNIFQQKVNDMKALDINNYDVREMNVSELKSTNGGILGFLSVFIIAAAAIGGYLLGTWICDKICEE